MNSKILAIALLFLIGVSGLASAARIQFWSDADNQGEHFIADLNGHHCYNLPGWFNDKASSTDTQGNCVRLYEHGDCKGNSVAMYPGTPGHNNFEHIGFNDILTSANLC